METQNSSSTIDRSGGARLLPWESLEAHAPIAFIVAGASLLASLLVPMALSVVIESSWLVGIALVGYAVLTSALGLLGLHRRTRTGSPWLALAGAGSATIAGGAGLVVLVLTGLTGAAMHLPTVEFSIGKQAFVLLSLTMAAGYGLGYLATGIGAVRSSSTPGRPGEILTVGGVLLLIPVVGGLLQLGLGIAMPAWLVFASLGLIAADTVAVGISLRSTG